MNNIKRLNILELFLGFVNVNYNIYKSNLFISYILIQTRLTLYE